MANEVTGENYSMQISLAYDGEFGFVAKLDVNMETKNAGYYANLFYYNPTTKKLEFMNAGKINADGSVELTFSHASDYTIVVSDVVMDGSGTDENGDGSPQSGDRAPIAWMFALLLASGGLMFAFGKKRIRK